MAEKGGGVEQKRRENGMLAVAQARAGTPRQLTRISFPGANYHLLPDLGVALDASS